MVAEAVPQVETEVTPPNEESLAPPNPTPEESSPPPEDQEETFESPYSDDDILKEVGLQGDSDGTGDGAGGSTDAVVRSPYAGLSDEEIDRKVDERATLKAQAALKASGDASYLQGIRGYVASAVKEADRLADASNGYLDREWVKGTLNTVKGDYEILLANDTRAAHGEGVRTVTAGVDQAVATTLSPAKADELRQANHQSWDAYLNGYAEEWAKTKGWAKPADVKAKAGEAAVKAHRSLEKIVDAALKPHGLSYAAITGNGGNEGVRPSAARGGGGGAGPSTMQGYLAGTSEQRRAWQKANPNIETQLIEREARRG